MSHVTVNPTNEATEMIIDRHTPEEVEHRIAQAARAGGEVGRTTFAQREGWTDAAAEIVEMQAQEHGKPIQQSRAEVHKSANAMRFYADHAEDFLAGEQLEDPAKVNASSAWTFYQPLGVVLAVMPWNYPIWQVVRFAAPALMAGNAGLLKHASNVPQAALFLDTLFERGGFPAGSFRDRKSVV